MLVLRMGNVAFFRGVNEACLGNGKFCSVLDEIVYCLAYIGYRVGGLDLYTSCVSGDRGLFSGLLWHYTGEAHILEVDVVGHLDAWSLGILVGCPVYVNSGELWYHVEVDFAALGYQTYFYPRGSSMFIYDFGDGEEFSDKFIKWVLDWSGVSDGVYFSGSGFINACFGLVSRELEIQEISSLLYNVILKSIGMLQARGLWVRGTIRDEILGGLPDEVLGKLMLMGAI